MRHFRRLFLMRSLGFACLCLIVFYSFAMITAPVAMAAAPEEASMMDCHEMADMQPAPDSHDESAPACCASLACCHLMTFSAFTPVSAPYAQAVQLLAVDAPFTLYGVTYRLERPPRTVLS
ncbi:MAG: hypothetical protein AB7G06_05755 [Bdellovibrionales bacterium]